MKKIALGIGVRALFGVLIASIFSSLAPEAAWATPNGTWLSQPQIWFHSSNHTLGQVMESIRAQQYRVVFLDFRKVSESVQLQVTQSARQQQLIPVVWVQSPQYRSLTVQQLVYEARYADGIQVDDHFFANYSLDDFYALRAQYRKSIFCSIQPFQVSRVPRSGCNQLDIQCYTTSRFQDCLKLADRFNAVVSLSSTDTLRYMQRMGGRSFNVFLWPNSDQFVR